MTQENIVHSTVGAGALLIVQEHVLLVQMNYGKFKGDWILPGGMLEGDEFPSEAAKRETFEETGVSVKIEDLLFTRFRKSRTNIYFVFRATFEGNQEIEQVQLSFPKEELLDARFWKIEDALKDSSVRPYTRFYIKRGLEMRTGFQCIDTRELIDGGDELFGAEGK